MSSLQGYKLVNDLVEPLLAELKVSPDDFEKVYPDWANALPADAPPAATQ